MFCPATHGLLPGMDTVVCPSAWLDRTLWRGTPCNSASPVLQHNADLAVGGVDALATDCGPTLHILTRRLCQMAAGEYRPLQLTGLAQGLASLARQGFLNSGRAASTLAGFAATVTACHDGLDRFTVSSFLRGAVG